MAQIYRILEANSRWPGVITFGNIFTSELAPGYKSENLPARENNFWKVLRLSKSWHRAKHAQLEDNSDNSIFSNNQWL
jgi:hypothetical protein